MPTKKATPRAKRLPTNPDNPLTRYLAAIRLEDEARWRYERARLKRETGLSKAHFARIVEGHGCSLDIALQFHTLTDGQVDPRLMVPATPWDRLDAYYRGAAVA